MKRTELLRVTPLRRNGFARTGTGLLRAKGIRRSKSAALRASERVLRQQRWQVITRDNDRCIVCGGPGEHVHHRMPRGAGGSSRTPEIHRLSLLVTLCSADHARVESERAWAVKVGLLIKRGKDEPDGSDVPVLYRGRKVLLDNDGCIVPVPCGCSLVGAHTCGGAS